MIAPIRPTSTAPAPVDAAFLSGFAKLRDLLDLLAVLRDATARLASPDGLRRLIDALCKLCEVLGVDPAWIAQTRRFLDDPRCFDLLLAVVRFVVALVDDKPAPQTS